ncbi:MAG: hypothetical protein Rhims3KO_14500 [Hyphomicrobiales bacterium]
MKADKGGDTERRFLDCKCNRPKALHCSIRAARRHAIGAIRCHPAAQGED